MDGNENTDPSVAIKVGSSVSFICRAVGVLKSEFSWRHSDFSSRGFVEVKPSAHVVIRAQNGESKITFTETSFDKSGVYQCATKVYSAQIDLHVFGIVDYAGANIEAKSTVKPLHNIEIVQNLPDLTAYPMAFCKFQVGRNGVNLASVRWYGSGLNAYRDMFDIVETKDTVTGVIYSNITMKVSPTSVRQDLFGPYTCSFNLIPGATVKQEVFFTISPVLLLRPTAETVYEGEAYNLTCEVIAYPKAEAGDITWSRNNQLLRVEDPASGRLAASLGYDPEGRVSLLSIHSPNDTLSFSSLTSADRAVYVCAVRTSVGNNSYGIFVRVKSGKSTFWPLLGIGIELLVLTAFILVYERNKRLGKAKTEPPALSDGHAGGNSNTARDSGVRHR